MHRIQCTEYNAFNTMRIIQCIEYLAYNSMHRIKCIEYKSYPLKLNALHFGLSGGRALPLGVCRQNVVAILISSSIFKKMWSCSIFQKIEVVFQFGSYFTLIKIWGPYYFKHYYSGRAGGRRRRLEEMEIRLSQPSS